ncbi:Flp family type IVb pilin [Streptomyces sp. NPDC003362]
MSDRMTQTMLRWKSTVIEAMERRADDRGQTAVEYLGIIAVVVAIVLAITGTDIGQSILDKITQQIDKVGNGS